MAHLHIDKGIALLDRMMAETDSKTPGMTPKLLLRVFCSHVCLGSAVVHLHSSHRWLGVIRQPPCKSPLSSPAP